MDCRWHKSDYGGKLMRGLRLQRVKGFVKLILFWTELSIIFLDLTSQPADRQAH
jgi:hypothetical protein